MPSAKLPDVNNAIVFHRASMIRALQDNDFPKTLMSWKSINALLPEDFRVKVSSEDYAQAVATKTFWQCSKCSSEISIDKIHVTEMEQSKLYRSIFSEKKNLMWQCPKCKAMNAKEQTTEFNEKPPEPAFFGIVPHPPKRNILQEVRWEREIQKWAIIAVPEIEAKVSEYRTTWLGQQDGAVIEE